MVIFRDTGHTTARKYESPAKPRDDQGLATMLFIKVMGFTQMLMREIIGGRFHALFVTFQITTHGVAQPMEINKKVSNQAFIKPSATTPCQKQQGIARQEW